MSNIGGYNWPIGDPSAIMRWFETGGMEELGRTYNYWNALIYTCTSSIWYEANSFDERREYRDTALAIVEAGHRMNVIPAGDYTERCVYIRMSYLRNSDQEPAWRENEMQAIATIFLDWIQLDAVGARELLATRPAVPANFRDLPVSLQRELGRLRFKHVRQLRGAKTVLDLISYGREYLKGEENEKIIAWLDMIPELP